MARRWLEPWVVPLAILMATATVGLLCSAALAQQPTSTPGQSWTDSITAPVKQGFDKLGQTLNPKPSTVVPTAEDDAVSLKGKAKPGPELYVAFARMSEQANNPAEAERQYQIALNLKSDDLPALLGYARLKDGLGKPNEAIQLYQRAARAHPRQASVYNNLGLCCARQNRLDEAAAAMQRAVELDPKNPLYRNNIAAVLVDQGKWRDAFVHLQTVHEEAAAYYNLGYLLNKKGQTQGALQQFTLALRADPSMIAARRWVEYLQRAQTQARLPQRVTTSGVTNIPGPAMPQRDAPAPSDEPMPQRLPPTRVSQPASDTPALPGISYEPSSAPAAPLPPSSMNSALRPLPRVN